MILYPFENITYKTKLTESEIVKQLNSLTIHKEKPYFSLWGNNHAKPYEGEIGEQRFYIKRIINYRNSFVPRITGTINQDLNGSTVNIIMKLPSNVIIFLCIWFAFMSVMSFLSFNAGTFYPYSFYFDNLEHWLPVGLIVFMYSLTMFCFKYESRKSKKDLQKIFG